MDMIWKGSIKRKLMRISMLTTCIALLLTSVLLIANEVITYRQSLIDRMEMMAKIIGTNSTAALMFNDQKTAQETLYALKSGKNITCAFLYNRKGDILAQYNRDASAGNCRHHRVGPDGYHVGIDHLDILQRIHLDNESIGTLYIKSDLNELYYLILWYWFTVFMIILLSIAIAFVLMSRLQKIITKPLSEMANVMNKISEEKNYSARVTIQSQDEVGILGEEFNEMLSQIQNRDTELEMHREHLQDLVTRRTEELARTNIDLQQELADRKRAEAKLRQQTDAMDAAIDGMAILNAESEYIYLNKAHVDVYGYENAGELIGKSWRILYDSDVLQRFDQKIMPEFSLKGYWHGEAIGTKKNGIKFPQELSLTAMADGGLICVVRDITDRKHVEEELQLTLESLRNAVGVTIQVMVSAIEMRDPYTAGHQLRVADLARAIATEMGLNHEIIDGIRMAGSIHDIGKLSIPAEILSKPTKLTNLEFSLIKEHSQSGYEMLKDVESPWPLAQIVYQHHERFNGTGYPQKLKGDEILIEARIMGVADVVEAMASHRPYRPGLGLEAALEEIKKNKGILYDADVVDACLRLFQEKGYQLIK
jgi:PAS domain S-box-containing protein/putative nucleotidyltransferase with HDIG domain